MTKAERVQVAKVLRRWAAETYSGGPDAINSEPGVIIDMACEWDHAFTGWQDYEAEEHFRVTGLLLAAAAVELGADFWL